MNSAWAFTLRDVVPEIAVPWTVAFSCTPLLAVVIAPDMNWAVAVPLESVVAEAGVIVPLLGSVTALKFTVLFATGLPDGSRTVASSTDWLVVPDVFGGRALGLACSTRVAALVATKFSGSVTCAEAVWATMLAGPELVDDRTVLALPVASVTALVGVTVPRVVLKVTVFPTCGAPAKKSKRTIESSGWRKHKRERKAIG